MFFTFDFCLLLYVIRLAGWLKHCNLSLSLSLKLSQALAQLLQQGSSPLFGDTSMQAHVLN